MIVPDDQKRLVASEQSLSSNHTTGWGVVPAVAPMLKSESAQRYKKV
ncbi:hypothetical protein A2U01_0060235 [Trifolium medium]|uniref:Uncharacterized protein n=1 Tax=Trifolium medium TaxID=97028 RepID=A0A392RTV5_9FABA|nr:hypothetical protein [Trifolium medium]